MFLEPVLALVLTLGTAIAQNCGAHPAVDTKLAKCSTVTPFCESLLGRSGSTTTISLATYTSTIPKSTLTYLELITSTIHTSAFVATRTVTTTLCMNGTIPAPTVDVMIAQSAAAAAAGSSCGVGTYSAAWVTTACDCALDSTVYVASTTQKVKKGTTLIITSTTERYTTTSTSYGTTVTATATVISDNCVPPAADACLNPETCEYYQYYECGIGGIYESCSCGFDANHNGFCFQGGACDLTCVHDWDCEEGSFCLYDSCCDGPTCAVADICVGDSADAVPARIVDIGAMTNTGAKLAGAK